MSADKRRPASSLPPASALTACLAVLQRACVAARLLGWAGEKDGLAPEQASELADLMDAVHNIPDLIQHWDRCDENLLRGMLSDFDQRHGTDRGCSLLEAYGRYRGYGA